MRRTIHVTSLTLVMLLLTAGHVSARDAQSLLPLPGDTRSFADGIDNRGEVVGRSVGAGSVDTAVRWDRDGKITILELCQGTPRPSLPTSTTAGQSVGASFDGTPAPSRFSLLSFGTVPAADRVGATPRRHRQLCRGDQRAGPSRGVQRQRQWRRHGGNLGPCRQADRIGAAGRRSREPCLRDQQSRRGCRDQRDRRERGETGDLGQGRYADGPGVVAGSPVRMGSRDQRSRRDSRLFRRRSSQMGS